MNKEIKGKIALVLEILIGCVFVFSGFVKVVDPLGGLYKIVDYLDAFGWEPLKPLGFFGMALMSAAEFMLGVCMLLGVRQKLTAIGVLLFMLVMTPITFYLALYNPVTDCGCFGDALVISNWATFWKNVVLLIAVIIVLNWCQFCKRGFTWVTEIAIAAYSLIFMLIITGLCFQNLPVIDFRPYKIGTNIPESMIIPDDAEKDVYETTLIYKKDGVEKEFTMENYPKDSTWEFVDSKNVLISKGYEPPIHDFVLNHSDDGDITDVILEDSNYVFLLIAHNLSEFDLLSNPGGAHYNYGKSINAAYEYAKENGYKFYCLTATGEDNPDMEKYKKATGAEYEYLNADEIMLKTIIRSSPGLMLIKEGNIINKWAVQNIPTFDQPLAECEYGQMELPNNKGRILLIALLYLIPLCLYLFKWGKRA
ncbi:MAG: DoxX family protein [Paludibacteraceae bacterium]|nr:DoxX family protein [Paludibacteraceae bacterium]